MNKNYYYDLNGNLVCENVQAGKVLTFFYQNKFGKFLKNLVNKKVIAKIFGAYQNTVFSKFKISSFVKKYKIDMSQFDLAEIEYNSFNDFFTRELKKGTRVIDTNLENFISPADSKLFVIPDICQKIEFFVKNEKFDLSEFLQNKKLADDYKDGMMLIFRLAPYDYHRFHFPTDCIPSKSEPINGILDSVSPIVYKSGYQPLTENERKLVILKSQKFDDIIFVSVGAMLVGKIVEVYLPDKKYSKGEQMGWFEFGGSTIVLLFKKGAIKLKTDFLKHSAEGFETEVKMGQVINEI